jgi:rubrerythrin
MNFFDMALSLENQVLALYRDMLKRCASHEGIHRILAMLIHDQEKHLQFLAGKKATGQPVENVESVGKEARRLFKSMQTRRQTFSCDLDQLRMYRQALELLKEKEAFYRKSSDSAQDRDDRAGLQKLAEEEKKQAMVLENIIMMVERPKQWLEDAEFNHLEEY